MRTALILSHLNGAHAAAAAWALKQVGVDARYECLAERLVEPDGASISEAGRLSAASFSEETDLIWFRKASRPAHLPGENDAGPSQIHVLANIEETFNVFVEGIEAEIKGRIVLNRPSAVRCAGNKIINMRAAQRAGLKVPDTLVTNSMSRAQAFASAAGGEIVYKPLRHNIWNIKANICSPASTALVDAKTFAESAETGLPFIVQKLIEKKSEWRVVYLCGNVYAFQQTRSAGAPIDWRSNAKENSEFTQVDVPSSFYVCLKHLADELLIDIFTIDFAIDSEWQAHFLDLNPSGQFLYLEEWFPDFHLLSCLCAALCDTLGHAANDLISMSRLHALNPQARSKPQLASSDLVGQNSRKSFVCGRLSWCRDTQFASDAQKKPRRPGEGRRGR